MTLFVLQAIRQAMPLIIPFSYLRTISVSAVALCGSHTQYDEKGSPQPA